MDRKRLETLVVEVVLVVRKAHLAAGGNALKHWTQLETAMRSAARQTSTATEWASTLQRRMQVASLPASGSSAVVDLAHFCDEHGAHETMLDMAEREHALIAALAKGVVEKAREAK